MLAGWDSYGFEGSLNQGKAQKKWLTLETGLLPFCAALPTMYCDDRTPQQALTAIAVKPHITT
jgi:hypothetical protein